MINGLLAIDRYTNRANRRQPPRAPRASFHTCSTDTRRRPQSVTDADLPTLTPLAASEQVNPDASGLQAATTKRGEI